MVKMKITPYKIKKGLLYLKRYGLKEFLIRLGERMEREEVPYASWYENHKITKKQAQMQREDVLLWENRPLFSICVPLYRTPEPCLRRLIESVQAQTYDNWELCLADGTDGDLVERLVEEYSAADERIYYHHLTENLGIAENTNAAFSLAKGEWIGLLDHDDCLAEDALYEVLAAAGEGPARASLVRNYENYWMYHEKAEAVYTDEDKIDEEEKEHFQPHFKPDFNVDLLRSNNYITHFFAVKREIVERVGGFSKDYEGAQDYDFIFRCTSEANRVAHVPRILYHWRISQGSTADNPASKEYAFEAGKRAIEAHLDRMGEKAKVSQRMDLGFYRVHYPVQGNPKVSILIPNKDEADTLQTCLASIAKSTYQNYQIIIIENNSTQAETFALYEELTGQKYESGKVLQGTLENGCEVRVVTYDGNFNYSAINNFGASYADGEYFVLLNNDIELLTEDWLEEMLGNCQREEVGIVGARLQYPDKTIQHAGIVVGMGGIAGNLFVGMKAERSGYLHKASIQLNYSAVTAACLMVSADLYRQVGGFAERLSVAFNDVDFCLKVRKAGYLVVYNPEVRAIHYESKSRGAEDTPQKQKRFEGEINYMKKHWVRILKEGDPYYNPNLSLNKSNYALKSNNAGGIL